ncbi:beta-ketoacyl-ACP synthase, partial [Mesorhizobium sp. M8A.F.Ca.ET.023.02.2.1]
MSSPHDVVITGIGIVSSLGEGPDAHFHNLAQPGLQPVLQAARFAPYTVLPLPDIA